MKSFKKVQKFLLEDSESDSDVNQIDGKSSNLSRTMKRKINHSGAKQMKFTKTIQRICEIQKKKKNLEFSQILFSKNIKKESMFESNQKQEEAFKNPHDNFRKHKLDQIFSKSVAFQNNSNPLPKNRKRSSRTLSDSEDSVHEKKIQKIQESKTSSKKTPFSVSSSGSKNTFSEFSAFVNTRKRTKRAFLQNDSSITEQVNQLDAFTEKNELFLKDVTSTNPSSIESSLNSTNHCKNRHLTPTVESEFLNTTEKPETNSQIEVYAIDETNSKLAKPTIIKPIIKSDVNVIRFSELKTIQVLLRKVNEEKRTKNN